MATAFSEAARADSRLSKKLAGESCLTGHSKILKTLNEEIQLEIKGNIIPFKNRKKPGINRATGQPTLYVEAEVREHMNQITASFESQLSVIIQERATATGLPRQSLIVSFLPASDSLKNIPILIIMGKHVKVGEEKTIVKIKKL